MNGEDGPGQWEQKPWEPRAPRLIPFQAGPARWSVEAVQMENGEPRYALTLDTPSTRLVTVWAADEIEIMASKLMETIGRLKPGLRPATIEDLRNLPPGTRAMHQ